MKRHLFSMICWMSLPVLMACHELNSPHDVILTDVRDTVTVMTYNIFHDAEHPAWGIQQWSDRRDAVVATIRSRAPDVLGLQEAKTWQVTWLLEELPDYAAVARGPYADPGIVEAHTVAVLFLKERFSVRESGHFWYSETPDTPGSYGSESFGSTAVPRMATWVRLGRRGVTNDQGLYVFNTHFIATGRAQDPAVARFKSAELLVKRIVGRTHPAAPVVVLGDLNTGPGTWPLRYILGDRCESGEVCPGPEPELRMTDAWESRNPGDTRTGTRCNAVTGSSGVRVDHVLVWNPRLDTVSPDILSADIVEWSQGCPSDHRPVAATIAFPAPR